MDLKRILGSSIYQIFSLLFVLIYFLGVLNTYFSDKTNHCDMTFMFEYPQFVRITVPENTQYPQYGLYAYSEGRLTEKARKMWFDGIPVLFLPGNSGSHMQGRSLASVALRKAMSHVNDFHFDFFMVSYNEELSGLYGGVLQSQTEFAAASITRILSLYKSNKYTKSIPSSVILIGHSMGGVIAKRLLAYTKTIHLANIAITLASPLEVPIINADIAMDNYYRLTQLEWDVYVTRLKNVRSKKILLSFGNGARDVLVPAGFTSSNDSIISALTTAIPGVWVSPDHVSIVWCKQLVIVINKFMFAIVDPDTKQIVDDQKAILDNAHKYFQANRSMILSPDINRPNVTMSPDGFWYEDNRRIYQISRPEINKTTYLMIRLVSFPQNRFVAIESVNLDDSDWIFGCDAQHVHGAHRYCNQAMSITELSRWTGAVATFGKRKLATIHLHDIMDKYPTWSHVIVKVSPTRKPVTLNIDINDLVSRQINVKVPSMLSLLKTVIKKETEPNTLYYEIILPGFDFIYQAYMLYVEPTENCKTRSHHASAEFHVPWAKNHEYYHYFTHLKHSPMKLRLFKSNRNATLSQDTMEPAKVILLLDPQCTYTISISASWYHFLAQLARNYSTVLFPYIAAIVLLIVRSNILQFKENGSYVSMYIALITDGTSPYFALVFSRVLVLCLGLIPLLSFLHDSPSVNNMEIKYFVKSLLVIPAYMAATGIVIIVSCALLVVMVFSSQLAHRLLFRIVWRGGTNMAEKVASSLQKVPLIVSCVLIMSAPISCGAASLAAGAAFYAFMISKMYEEYLEDYVYLIMAKIASRICRAFKSKKKNEEAKSTELNSKTTEDVEDDKTDNKSIEDNKENNEVTNTQVVLVNNDESLNDETKAIVTKSKEDIEVVKDETKELVTKKEELDETDNVNERKKRRRKSDHEMLEDLNCINFHVMMFSMWVIVTIVNVPVLLTWARNFKYSMSLSPDTSYHTGTIMSVCSVVLWQLDSPTKNLKYVEELTSILFTIAVFTLALGPLSLAIVNYGVTLVFTLITLKQFIGNLTEENVTQDDTNSNDAEQNNCTEPEIDKQQTTKEKRDTPQKNDEPSHKESEKGNTSDKNESTSHNVEPPTPECDVCNENKIFKVFKNLRDKFSFNEEL